MIPERIIFISRGITVDLLISQIYFWNETVHVSDGSSVHHQEFFTVHTAMVYIIQVCWHIPLLCVQWKTPDDGQRNRTKHVQFYSKNKFEKLVHLVGFIIRMYHDARSPERHITLDTVHNVRYIRSKRYIEICLCSQRKELHLPVTFTHT